MGSKTRLSSYCTKRANNGGNLVTSRKKNTRLARPIAPIKNRSVCADFWSEKKSVRFFIGAACDKKSVVCADSVREKIGPSIRLFLGAPYDKKIGPCALGFKVRLHNRLQNKANGPLLGTVIRRPAPRTSTR